MTLGTVGEPMLDGLRTPDPEPGNHSSQSRLVRRPRLLDDLVMRPAAVSLVCAPAGSGKTALLHHLATTPGSAPTGYVDLSRLNPTPKGIWSAILAILRSLDVYPPTSPIHEISPPPTGL